MVYFQQTSGRSIEIFPGKTTRTRLWKYAKSVHYIYIYFSFLYRCRLVPTDDGVSGAITTALPWQITSLRVFSTKTSCHLPHTSKTSTWWAVLTCVWRELTRPDIRRDELGRTRIARSHYKVGCLVKVAYHALMSPSYDYGSPIQENRMLSREKYSELKLQAQFLRVSPAYLTAIPQNQYPTNSVNSSIYTDNAELAVTRLADVIGNRTSFWVVRWIETY